MKGRIGSGWGLLSLAGKRNSVKEGWLSDRAVWETLWRATWHLAWFSSAEEKLLWQTPSLSFSFFHTLFQNSICEGFFFQATQCHPFQLIRFCNHLRLSSSNFKQNIKVRFKSCVRKRRHLFPNMRWKIALYITQIIVDKRKIQWYTKSGQNYRNNKDIRRCLFFFWNVGGKNFSLTMKNLHSWILYKDLIWWWKVILPCYS